MLVSFRGDPHRPLAGAPFDGGSSIFNFICGTLLAVKITSLWRGALLLHRPYWLLVALGQWGNYLLHLLFSFL